MEPVESTGNSGAATVDFAQPEPASALPPQWWIDGDVNKCSVCNRTREHCIRRLGTGSAAPVCDDCNDERTKR